MNAPAQRRVLVVDDDRQLAELLCAAVRLASGEPVAVERLGEALVEIRREPFALVLLDLRLPDATPEMTIKSIWRLTEAGARRVVVITGSPVSEALEAACIEAGAHAVLGKNEADFVALVSELLEADSGYRLLAPEMALRVVKRKPPE